MNLIQKYSFKNNSLRRMNSNEKYRRLMRSLQIKVNRKDSMTSEDERPAQPNELSFDEKYRLLNFIGEGTHCAVFLAESTVGLPERYAVKVFRTEDEERIQLIIKTFRIQQMANNHQHIIMAYDLFINRISGIHHLVMEYSEFPSLKQLLEEGARIPQPTIIVVLFHMAEAIKFLHSKRICHRDIKPDNILIDLKSGSIKLIDFGVSILYRGMMMTPTGCEQYRAPEIATNLGYSENVDTWAMGIVAFQMMARKLPVSDSPREELCELESVFDQKLLNLVRQLLEPDTFMRISPQEILEHCCFGKRSSKITLVPDGSPNRSKSFHKKSEKYSSRKRQHSIESSEIPDKPSSSRELQLTMQSRVYSSRNLFIPQGIQFVNEVASPTKGVKSKYGLISDVE